MIKTFLLHKQKILFLGLVMLTCLLVSAWVGDAKYWHEIDWMDVVGEGGSAIAMTIWIAFILGSRPQGRVTNLLTIGLGAMMVAFWQDALDEFIRIPAEQWWGQWIESVAMPLGISILTFGLYHWYQEQIVINQTLKKREQFYREHLWFDRVTHINRVDSLKKQLALIGQNNPEQVVAIIMLDVAKFSWFNREYGRKEGDRFLFHLTELIQLNMASEHLLTRYASDRFALILPNTSLEKAKVTAEYIKQACHHFYYHLQKHDAVYVPELNIGVAGCNGQDAQELIEKGNKALARAKQLLKVA